MSASAVTARSGCFASSSPRISARIRTRPVSACPCSRPGWQPAATAFPRSSPDSAPSSPTRPRSRRTEVPGDPRRRSRSSGSPTSLRAGPGSTQPRSVAAISLGCGFVGVTWACRARWVRWNVSAADWHDGKEHIVAHRTHRVLTGFESSRTAHADGRLASRSAALARHPLRLGRGAFGICERERFRRRLVACGRCLCRCLCR